MSTVLASPLAWLSPQPTAAKATLAKAAITMVRLISSSLD